MKIEERIINVAADVSGMDVDGITLKSTYDTMHLDSLDKVEMVMAIEAEFEISISDEDYDRWGGISDIVEYIKFRAST